MILEGFENLQYQVKLERNKWIITHKCFLIFESLVFNGQIILGFKCRSLVIIDSFQATNHFGLLIKNALLSNVFGTS